LAGRVATWQERSPYPLRDLCNADRSHSPFNAARRLGGPRHGRVPEGRLGRPL